MSDSNVLPLYGERVRQSLLHAGAGEVSTFTLPAGEQSKTLATVEALYHFGVAEALDRGSVVLALGGGVVGDVAGFFAATFLRGVDYVQMPTSLLAMVDSSVGGKVGVDLGEGKNLVGAFYQPCLVVADTSLLDTLPPDQLRCGLAEVVKYGVILDRALFELLDSEQDRVLALDPELVETVVARCCRLKAAVVEEDEKESGKRAILNYGHTFGHALEQLGGFGTLNHGQGVAIGMGMAADLAAALGKAPAQLAQRQDALLSAYGLPVSTGNELRVTPHEVLACMYRDKKVRGGRLRLVLPVEIGRVEVVEVAEHGNVLAAIGGRLEQR